MHVYATGYKLCNFNDSAYTLNGPIFAFKTDIAQCKINFKLEQH